jgi:hypothetical protein
MCTWQARGGKLGKSSSAVCVECMIAPFGLQMEMGCWANCLLITGVSTVQKCAVLPVSAIRALY